MKQQVIALHEQFYNDGAWYVLSSTSLANSGLNPEEMVSKLQGNQEDMQQLLADGICLPLFFPGDCALDGAVIVVGDLTAEQEREWLGRIQSKLHIPCGEFMLVGGGGCEDDWEAAINYFAPPDPHLINFQKVRVSPGDYLVEVYAFLGSMNFNFHLDNIKRENWQQWFHLKGIPESEQPQWFRFLQENDYIDSERFDLQEYIIRLAPLYEAPPIPVLDEEIVWCSQYEFRQLDHCPMGIRRSQLK